jgi:hypothetical protein
MGGVALLSGRASYQGKNRPAASLRKAAGRSWRATWREPCRIESPHAETFQGALG